MSGPSKKSSSSCGQPPSMLVRVERLREQTEEFQRTVEDERQALLIELHARQAHGRGRPIEHVWSIRRNGKQYDCELVGHGDDGWEVLLLRDGEWFYSHRFETRVRAEAKAEAFKARYLADGGVVIR